MACLGLSPGIRFTHLEHKIIRKDVLSTAAVHGGPTAVSTRAELEQETGQPPCPFAGRQTLYLVVVLSHLVLGDEATVVSHEEARVELNPVRPRKLGRLMEYSDEHRDTISSSVDDHTCSRPTARERVESAVVATTKKSGGSEAQC